MGAGHYHMNPSIEGIHVTYHPDRRVRPVLLRRVGRNNGEPMFEKDARNHLKFTMKPGSEDENDGVWMLMMTGRTTPLPELSRTKQIESEDWSLTSREKKPLFTFETVAHRKRQGKANWRATQDEGRDSFAVNTFTASQRTLTSYMSEASYFDEKPPVVKEEEKVERTITSYMTQKSYFKFKPTSDDQKDHKDTSSGVSRIPGFKLLRTTASENVLLDVFKLVDLARKRDLVGSIIVGSISDKLLDDCKETNKALGRKSLKLTSITLKSDMKEILGYLVLDGAIVISGDTGTLIAAAVKVPASVKNQVSLEARHSDLAEFAWRKKVVFSVVMREKPTDISVAAVYFSDRGMKIALNYPNM